MGIRSNSNSKNRLTQSIGPTLTVVQTLRSSPVLDDQYRFSTFHPQKPCVVDLLSLVVGQDKPNGGYASWKGAFGGRPELTRELAPAIIDRCLPLARSSAEQLVMHLRAWWRMLDQIEKQMPELPRVSSVTQINELHRQYVIDHGMRREPFNTMLSLLNITRSALNLKQLYWFGNGGKKTSQRYLAPQWQYETVRRALKRRWFEVLDRWEMADTLLQRGYPFVQQDFDPILYAEQEKLLTSCRRFNDISEKVGLARPSGKDLYGEMKANAFNHVGFNVGEMVSNKFPNGEDIRVAFHLCLATTGWNPAVLLSLNVENPFLEAHPRDSKRYVLRNTKARARGAEQISEGLFKTQGSAGFILQTLIERTSPLREQLRQELKLCRSEAKELPTPSLDLQQKISSLEAAVKSPWIFAPKWGDRPIAYLRDENFSGVSGKNRRSSFLTLLINDLNKYQLPDKQLDHMSAGDLRDAFAASVYEANAGSILAVMKALGHRRVNTTEAYLHNTLLNQQHRKLFSIFSEALWNEIRLNGRVDPTVLAKWSRDGEVTSSQRERLDTYRTLMISRIGVGCKSPSNPPKHIAPDFISDGKKLCPIQRCTLCLEHAVILPESLDGLSKRLAELHHLRARMGVGPFEGSQYCQEMSNTELALTAFDNHTVKKHFTLWTSQIESGEHRFMEFDGVAEG